MAPLDPTEVRRFAADIVDRLRRAGYETYWAGGCVRDQLLGATPKDYDVATAATPDQVRTVFGRRRTLPIGAAFGVITVLGPRQAGQVEVATFREDLDYVDGRHPEGVSYSTANRDAERRDFTMNGLFYDPRADRVIDYVGGRDDLERKLVRAIGDPRARFEEDKLRLLRAVRFAATFQFQIESATFRAVQEMADQIWVVSGERIGAELHRMLLLPARTRAMQLLRESGLLAQILPELVELGTGDRYEWDETMRVLAALDAPTHPLALAGLVHRVDEPGSVDAIGSRCRWPNQVIQRARWIVSHDEEVRRATDLSWPQLQRLLIQDGIRELLALHEAIAGPEDTELAYCRCKLALPADQLDPSSLLTGDDLVEHGLTPGPDFRVLLRRARDAQLLGKILTKEEALALTDQLLAEGWEDDK